MEDKIEVGEYVRNESGYIHKVDSFDKLTNFFKDEDGKLKEWIGEDIFGNIIAEIIVKHSKNIIKLLEKCDYVNGEPIETIFCSDDEFEITTTTEYLTNIEDIKSIVTKEQFDSIKYEI